MAWFLPSPYLVSSVQILFSFCGKLNLAHRWHSLSVLNPLYFHLESHFSIADYDSDTNILTACSSWLGCEAIFLNHGNNLFSMHLIWDLAIAKVLYHLSDRLIMFFQTNDGLPHLQRHLFWPHSWNYSDKIWKFNLVNQFQVLCLLPL